MKHCKKYISIFLLFVFTWVVLPPSFVHEVFANHQDTECLGHAHNLKQVETLHKHCDVFKIVAPLYDSPEFVVFEKPARVLIAEFYPEKKPFYSVTALFARKSRGPPLS